MTVTLEEYQKLKTEVETAEREAAKAEGALQQALARLESEFGVKSIAEAEELAKKLDAEAKETEVKYRKELDDFKEKWKNRL